MHFNKNTDQSFLSMTMQGNQENQTKIGLCAASTKAAQQAAKELQQKIQFVPENEADILVVLGGDGFMLETVHRLVHAGQVKPIYGMNQGTIGFLMNHYNTDDIISKISKAHSVCLKPLVMRAVDKDGQVYESLAINEVAVHRQSKFASKIRIKIDNIVRLPELVCDGVMLSTPAGSTAYNLSALGPILPLDSNLLALTPVSAFRPRRWHGALLHHRKKIMFEVLEREKRPVMVTADHREFKDVVSVEISEDSSQCFTLLFDANHHLEERIFLEQFVPF